MSRIATTSTTAVLLVADLADEMSARRTTRPVSRSLSVPSGLRTTCPQSEIRQADARHNARLEAACTAAQCDAWERFEQGCIDIDTYRTTVRAARAHRDARLVPLFV